MARPPKQRQNPISSAVSVWLDSLPPTRLDALVDQLSTDEAKHRLLACAPKRWVVYEPMALLPSGSFTAPPWPALLESLAPAQTASLWTAILHRLSPRSRPPLTHLAINEGIPPHLSQPEEAPKQENVLRSPTGLRLLHGAFGPASSSSSRCPSAADFDAALWVSTTQNGLVQTWAPRHTMFSRGNVKEKARLLSFPSSSSSSRSSPPSNSLSHSHSHHASPSPPPPPPTAVTAATDPSPSPSPSPPLPAGKRKNNKKWAVDLYAGIGYFAFSLARLDLRVLCWEVNAWSVEGLRRGAARNGWRVRVVTAEEAAGTRAAGKEEEAGTVASSLAEVVSGGRRGIGDGHGEGEGDGEGPQIVVFLEDNAAAAGRVRRLREEGVELEVVHVNCGFLPSSEPVWRDAWEIVRGGAAPDGWLHLHENVGVADIERRRGEVQRLFDRWTAEEEGDDATAAKVEHVELVKTFAPDVWHCVFDVYITRSSVVT